MFFIFRKEGIFIMNAKTTSKKTTSVKEDAKKEVKTETKTEVKAPVAKTPAKTTKTAPKAKTVETKVSVTLQYQSNNTTVDSIIESIKAAYKADGNTAAIETIEVYVQPENRTAYYVINGNSEGKSVNF